MVRSQWNLSIENARKYLESEGFDTSKIMEMDHSSATVGLAAEALGCESGMIAKSLTFDVKGEPIMIVTAGDRRIDNAKYKAFFGAKAKMLTREEVSEKIGHDVGGVCPFGIKDGVKVYLDDSLRGYEYVYPACGSHNSAIKLSIPELEKLSHFTAWVEVTK